MTCLFAELHQRLSPMAARLIPSCGLSEQTLADHGAPGISDWRVKFLQPHTSQVFSGAAYVHRRYDFYTLR